jgi:hypothetical protein
LTTPCAAVYGDAIGKVAISAALSGETLSGKARSASSSYIAPGHFDSAAKVAIDLLAMRRRTEQRQAIVEYDPPIVPIRFLFMISIVVLSGVTTVLPTLEEQLNNIIPRITAPSPTPAARGTMSRAYRFTYIAARLWII